ncbi:MAG: hemopexin repeat-containing protein [Coleofasciculus sp.]
MWLVQVLFAVTDWMHTNDFTSEELKYVLTGQLKDQTETESSIDEKINVLNTLYQNFKSVILEADLFESDRFDSRSARVIHLALTGEGSKVVSKKDRRLVIYDQRSVEQLAYTALNQLEMIKKEDFMHLGLEQKMRDKIFNNMIIKGYINPEGSLNEEILPQSAHDFQIETDFSGYKEEVFTLIYGLFSGAVESTDFDEEDEDIENDLDDETIATLEFSVYPSDLEEIEDLSQAHRDELYDNLIFNGYIDEEGNVLQPDFFALAENAADFKVNTPIAAYSTDVFNLISAQVNKFNEERLILDQEIFSALPLNAMEIDDLMENLKFNEYINSDNVLTNKQELLAQDVKGFKLALPFYPHRHKILNTIKELITEFKSYFYTLTPEFLAGIADQIVAEQIYKTIESDYLQDGRLKEDKKAFFLDQDNVEQFTVGSYFTPIDTAVIFSTLGEIIAGYQKYQLITKPLDELDFNLEEREELMDVLETNGYGIEQGKIPEEKVEYFLNSNNALDFTLDKFEDYNKDIFFVLHAIAKEIDASVREISENVKMLAEKQERVVLETLQDAFGIDAEIVKAVCQQVFRDGETIVEEFLIPVFALVNSQDVISAEPNNQKFNLAYRRILQFARLAAKLRLSQEETEVVFHEQDLVEKFPEKLVLPDTIDRFDALLEHPDGVIYIFKDDNYWAYSAETYNLVETKDNTSETKDNKLTSLSDKFAGLTKIDAAFTDKQGTSFIIAGGNCYCNEKGSKRWIEKDRVWGKMKSNFDDPEKVEAAFQDKQGRTYLFAGDQYIRYSGNDYDHVDEGYPLTIAGNWKTELSNAHLPQEFQESIDAAFQGTNDKSYLFKGSKFVCSDNLSIEMDINQTWGKVKNNFKASKKIDAAYADGGNLLVFVGNQVMLYQDSLENDQVKGLEGFPKLIKSHYPNVPSEFADGVDAAFKGEDGKIHLFKDGMVVSFESNQASQASMTVVQVKEQWGVVRNTILESGRVDAAFVSLEGKTYLFSGNQYFRYKGNHYDAVEEGYPKYIVPSLKDEPRFKNLNVSYENGIDAAFADRRTIYLFKQTEGYVVSETLSKKYDDLGFTQVDCAFIDQGALFVAENATWHRYSSLEGKAIQKTAVEPPRLREVPSKFKTGLDAVLQGIDRNTYLFKGQDCFNVLLNKEYPLAEEWGRERNTIYINNTVDAAFVGRDGKTYLFSGDQYVTYAGDTYIKAEIEDTPKPIQEKWGGLTSVALAFVKDDKTYLFEKADDEGKFRYLCYSTDDYTQPDPGFPQTAEPDFLQIPATYTEEGFNQIDAVLFEADNMFVLSENRYIQFNFTENQWAYPRPLDRIWRGIPLNHDSFARVKTAFTGRDGATYFFADNYYVKYENVKDENNRFTSPALIQEDWGIVHNNFVNNSPDNKIDAACVWQNKITYLVSGDQYVRYSGKDYRYVDEGYPKQIANHLRREAGFENLPEDFEEIVSNRIANGENRIIDAIIANHRTLYIFMGSHCYVVSQTLDAVYDIDIIGNIKNTILQKNQVDAAFVNERGQTFLFSGDQGVRYSDDRYDTVDDGYPQPIATVLTTELGISTMPEMFQYGIDAALRGRDGNLYLFKNEDYLSSAESEPKLIKETWGKVKNNFISHPGAIDAAFVAPDHHLYVFKGDQYIRYHDAEQEFVDAGYPHAIKDNWGNLPVIFPVNFEESIDGGFVFEGKTYLLKGDDYVRYSDSRYQYIDSIYPQTFKYRWGDWADYRLSDIKAIARFKQLQDGYSNGDYSLTDFLHPEKGLVKDPYKMLAEMFGWDSDDVKWLKRNNGFLGTDNRFEVRFNLEMVIKFVDVFSVTEKMGTSPAKLYTEVWQKMYPPSDLGAAADTLYKLLGLLNS